MIFLDTENDDLDDGLLDPLSGNKNAPSTSNDTLSALFADDDLAGSNSIEKSKSSLFYKPARLKTTDSKDSNTNASSNDVRKSSTQTSQTTQVASGVFCATAVDVYKLENDTNKYQHVGKFGIALLGNDCTFTGYRLILYTGKNKLICTATIMDNFRFVCQENNYSNFYDDAKRNWSIHFDQSENQRLFCLKIAHSLFAVQYRNAIKVSNQDLPMVVVLQDIGSVRNTALPDGLKDHLVSYQILNLAIYSLPEPSSKQFQSIPSFVLETPLKLNSILVSSNEPFLLQLFSNMGVGNSRFVVLSVKKFLEVYQSLLNSNGSESWLKQFISEISNNNLHPQPWKIAFEVTLDSVLEHKSESNGHNEQFKSEMVSISDPPVSKVSESLTTTVSAGTQEQTPSSSVISARMAKIGAVPILTMASLSQSPSKNDSDSNTTTEEKVDLDVDAQSSKNQTSLTFNKSDVDSVEVEKEVETSLNKLFFSDNLNQLRSELLDLKNICITKFSELHQLQLNNCIPSSSISDVDSAMVLSSIKTIIEENSRLKQTLADKTQALEVANQKLIEQYERKSIQSDSSTEKTTILQLKEELLAAKERIAELNEQKYHLSMEQLKSEKRLLEAEKETTELNNRLVEVNRRFKTTVKQLLNNIFEEFHQEMNSRMNVESSFVFDSIDSISQVLSQVMIRVKQQEQSQMQRSQATAEISSSVGLRKSSSTVTSLSQNHSVENESHE